MVDFNKLFDVLYSDTVPFSVKESILENVSESISEEELNASISEAEENSYYIDILNSLAYSNMSEATVNEIIDEVFGNVAESDIEEATYNFIKENCLRIIMTGEIPIVEGSTDYVGLSKIDRDEKEGNTEKAKKPSALDKLKGAVNKVKAAAKNSLPGYILQDRPTGLSQIKGLSDIKADAKKEAPKAEVKHEAPKAEEKKTGTSIVPVKSGVPAAANAPKAEEKKNWRWSDKGVPNPEEPLKVGASDVKSLPANLSKVNKPKRKQKV